MDKTETIKVENLTTGYSGKRMVTAVTEGVTTSLYSGELTCLLGPNGAGKSTLLKTLAGFLPPLSGKIIIEGKELQDYNDTELAKMIGVVLTERIAVANMSVYELISMGRSPYTGFWGRLSQSDREIVEEAIALVRIEDLRDRMVDTLSDGERQKVMIAKALAQETPIIFLDEPTAFLDYPSKVEILRLLQNLSRIKRKTVFLSTHDLELALQIADKVWLIDKTHGVKTGTPEDLSLAGYMSEYFEKEGVRFDLATGLFHIDNKLDRKIRLEGDTVRNRLLQKALARNGISADTDIDCEDKIQSDENGFFFNGRKYKSIEALLEAIL